jgi:hypothetical protein
LISRRRRGRERGGKGWRPASADATRFIGHSIEVCLPAGRIPRKDHRGHLGAARERKEEAARSTGIASSSGVPEEAKAACERSGRARVEHRAMDARARSLPVMSRQIFSTEGSEPGLVRWEAGRLDRLCEGPRSVRKGGPRSGSADQRTLDDGVTGWQSRHADEGHETLPHCAQGVLDPPRGGRERGRATRTATSVSTPRMEPSSSARAPRSRSRSKQRLLQVPESLVVCRWKRRASCRHPLARGGRPAPPETCHRLERVG